ncbi:MAG TPA: hypothetical protein VFB73_00470 [Chloroflexota bacterium]|nr:hypothetical protein [Chloroflexota bacterium]
MTATSTIRALRPTHLVGLRALDNRPSCAEITAPVWPRVCDGDSRLPLWSLLPHSMAHPTGQRRAWVHVSPDGIDGLVVSRARCGGLVWDVRHLWVDSTRESVAEELLRQVCTEAALRGARRVFLETGLDEPATTIARQAGFAQYTRAMVYAAPAGPREACGTLVPGRPRLRGDEHRLFQLYNAAVPAPVRAAEALTLEEWLALHKGPRRWTPGLFVDRYQYVWDVEDSLVAWMELACSPRGQQAEWLVHPAHGSLCDSLVAYALTQVNPKLPFYVTCREYQVALRSALERTGFALVGERAVFVRQLTVRLPERRSVVVRTRPSLGGRALARW